MLSAADANLILNALAASQNRGADLRQEAMRLLTNLEGYDWCGIYRLEGSDLELDEYVGEPTEHTRIPIGQGVCGTAVAENSNQVISDVRELKNYLSCSLETRSEIVVLIHLDGEILGQIDIDGHKVGTFKREDEKFLDRVAEVLAKKWL
jgi:L-methionine (R)-S-oxide reductase